jgi:RNA polymerase sigma-70 factor (ECF subfamily)
MLCADVLRRRGVIAADARGDWNELASRLRPFIARRLASPGDVDDVLQEVLLRMHRGMGALDDDERFGAWVYRIARNAVIDHQRRQAHRVTAPPEIEVGADEPPIEITHELAQYLAFFVARLPSPYREAITLVELEGMSQVAAARMLGISVSGMKSRVQRGRTKLREVLDACCELAVDAAAEFRATARLLSARVRRLKSSGHRILCPPLDRRCLRRRGDNDTSRQDGNRDGW